MAYKNMKATRSVLLCAVFLSCITASMAFTPTLGKLPKPGPYQEVNFDEVSLPCLTALEKLVPSNGSDIGTLLQVIDALGKPQPGFLEGNLAWVGHYDQCMNITDFRYCTIQINTTVISPLLPPIAWGVCMPKECTSLDVSNSIEWLTGFVDTQQYFDLKAISGAVTVCAKDPPRPYDAGFVLTVLLCSVVIALAVCGAFVELFQRVKLPSIASPAFVLQPESLVDEDNNDDDDEPLLELNGKPEQVSYIPPADRGIFVKFLQCFSLTNNLSKLLDSKQSDRSITCLNGIRVISMTWVILGHTFIFTLNLGALENAPTAITFIQRFGMQAVGNAFFSVDTFFFLSGFLLGFLTLSRMAKSNGKIPWFWFYFHRFWRLTPVYMFTILVYMYLTPYFGEGPFWQAYVPREVCPKYWWTNLLYINNFWPKDFGGECIAWSWYLANDMQFFIISPIFLISLFMFPMVGLILIVMVLFASFVVTGTLIGYYDLDVALGFAGEGAVVSGAAPPLDFFSLVYGKPYCRIAPYLVGIVLGYGMYVIGNRKVRLNPVLVALGWAIASGLAVSCVYGLYPSYHDSYSLSTAANVLYGTFSRFVWAIALAWVVFACKFGYGGWVNDFLSWNGWVVLSRLTYTAYLVHPIVIFTFYFNFASAIHYSFVLLSFYFAGCCSIAYGLAFIFSLAIEYPFANMEKLLMPTTVQTGRTVQVTQNNTSVQ